MDKKGKFNISFLVMIILSIFFISIIAQVVMISITPQTHIVQTSFPTSVPKNVTLNYVNLGKIINVTNGTYELPSTNYTVYEDSRHPLRLELLSNSQYTGDLSIIYTYKDNTVVGVGAILMSLVTLFFCISVILSIVNKNKKR